MCVCGPVEENQTGKNNMKTEKKPPKNHFDCPGRVKFLCVRDEQLVSGKNVVGEWCVAVKWGEFSWGGAGQTVLNQSSQVEVGGSGCDSPCYKSKNH